jgi:predicted phage terminase large subunit-like protein
MAQLTKEIKLHPAQAAFRNSNAISRGYVGGIGSGKSWVGAYDLLRRAKPNRLYMVVTPTYGMLRDASWRTLMNLAKELQYFREENKTEMRMVLGNGAEVLGRSADDPERLRGPNLSGAWMDEASLMHRGAFDIMLGRLREAGEQGWLSATFTPQGKSHWTYKVFGIRGEGVELFHSHTRDNPFLPATFYTSVMHQYAPNLARQELGGEFVELEGAEFPGAWFGDHAWFDEWPATWQCKTLSLDPSKGKDSKAGDYGAFVKLMVDTEGTVYCEADIERRNVDLLAETAVEHCRTWKPDLFGCETNQFQELLADNIGRMAASRGLVLQPYGLDNRVSKVVRIRRLTPFLSKGEIRFKSNSPGTQLLVEQLQDFPGGDHDDGPDALEMAVRLAQVLIGGQEVNDGLGSYLPVG